MSVASWRGDRPSYTMIFDPLFLSHLACKTLESWSPICRLKCALFGSRHWEPISASRPPPEVIDAETFSCRPIRHRVSHRLTYQGRKLPPPGGENFAVSLSILRERIVFISGLYAEGVIGWMFLFDIPRIRVFARLAARLLPGDRPNLLARKFPVSFCSYSAGDRSGHFRPFFSCP